MSYIYPNSNTVPTKYKVYFVFDTYKIYLGTFTSYDIAQKALDEARCIMSAPIGELEFPNFILSFKKIISLCNFRDHKTYIKNPIYILPNCFHYYLSKTCILTFDLKDLFYFSTYKIHKRGNYLYTQDSISQKSILSRFGILNHSVIGKDYRFKNNDCYDFRSQNIELITNYKGVTKKETGSKVLYVTNIFTDKNITVGHYTSEVEAAIAYNKAINILWAHGNNKDFTPNVIPFLTKEEYTELYNKVCISPRLTHQTHRRKRVISQKQYRGISKDGNSYKVHIGYQSKQYYLGMYPTEKRAAQAYNYASFYLFGRQGYVNPVSPLIDDRDTIKIAHFLSKYGILKESGF